jgi:hypothetical protein
MHGHPLRGLPLAPPTAREQWEERERGHGEEVGDGWTVGLLRLPAVTPQGG